MGGAFGKAKGMGMLICIVCRKSHKARRDKFPKTLVEIRIVDHPDDKKKILKRKIKMQFVIGHVCAKCDRKWQLKSFMKHHKITADKTGRRKISDMIRDKMKEINMRGIRLPASEGKPRGRG